MEKGLLTYLSLFHASARVLHHQNCRRSTVESETGGNVIIASNPALNMVVKVVSPALSEGRRHESLSILVFLQVLSAGSDSKLDFAF